jgi:pectin methylesterase-like acyl-CoA thioesterase
MVTPQPARAAIIREPQDQTTIQRAINAAQNGDVILVSPGTYNERLVISGKAITLASLYYSTGDEQYISNTIINGSGGIGITIEATAGPETTITGLTIRDGSDGIRTFAKQSILHNRFISNGDALDFTGASGEVRDNYFNSDDAIDLITLLAIIENNRLDNG